MRRHRTSIILLIICLCFAGVLAYQYQASTAAQYKTPPRISVVLYESGSDRWASVSLGLRQACAEVGVEMSNVILADSASADHQIAAIEREIAGGADGLIVAANNSEGMAEYLEQVATRLPLVLLETGAGETLSLVAPDNAAMGRSLAEGLVQKEKDVIVLAENLQRESVLKRYDAFLEVMRANGIPVTVWQTEGQDAVEFLSAQLAAFPNKALIAFDTQMLENAVDAAVLLSIQPRIYGIGSNEKIVYYLDRQLVRETCTANEFNMGYIALMRLAQQMGLATPWIPETIDFVLARHDNLYEPTIERLLFPIIQ